MLSSPSPTNEELICRVCGSAQTVGYNYGVLCCGACQLFFFQATSKDYLTRKFCHNNNSCEITVQTRKCCISCRLQKCLSLGMDRSCKGKTGPRSTSFTHKMIICVACGDEKEFRSLKQNVSKLCHKCTAFFSQIKIGKNSVPSPNECVNKQTLLGTCQGPDVSACRFCRFQRCLMEKANCAKEGGVINNNASISKLESSSPGSVPSSPTSLDLLSGLSLAKQNSAKQSSGCYSSSPDLLSQNNSQQPMMITNNNNNLADLLKQMPQETLQKLLLGAAGQDSGINSNNDSSQLQSGSSPTAPIFEQPKIETQSPIRNNDNMTLLLQALQANNQTSNYAQIPPFYPPPRPKRNSNPANKWLINCVICSDSFTKTKRYIRQASVNKNYVNSCKSCREFYCHIKAGRVSYPSQNECFKNKHCQSNIKSCRFCRLSKYLAEIKKQEESIDGKYGMAAMKPLVSQEQVQEPVETEKIQTSVIQTSSQPKPSVPNPNSDLLNFLANNSKLLENLQNNSTEENLKLLIGLKFLTEQKQTSQISSQINQNQVKISESSINLKRSLELESKKISENIDTCSSNESNNLLKILQMVNEKNEEPSSCKRTKIEEERKDQNNLKDIFYPSEKF